MDNNQKQNVEQTKANEVECEYFTAEEVKEIYNSVDKRISKLQQVRAIIMYLLHEINDELEEVDKDFDPYKCKYECDIFSHFNRLTKIETLRDVKRVIEQWAEV